MKTKFTERLCPTCRGKGYIKRKGYSSKCKKARRHLYTNELGTRVEYCVHCGLNKPARYG